ncbi:hypothetical protein PDE_04030 [Penicillium oxalicum 114-2]|uniref:Uncharacterized protein n=1 Tax=Penicillium oxalicum (strain 114-2 / CGMCC 5302) TaxID=933388 RepID=S7ZK68_PENO1|nr:hypothetical protein PDE_04030 [Penicillium oxalicum 114-2]
MPYVYQSEGVVSEEGANPFLEHLPPETPVYHYDRECVMDSLLSPYSVEDRFIVLKHFPPEMFAECDDLPKRCDYSPILRILIIRMPSQPHEEAAASFEAMIVTISRKMQVYRRIAACGATRIDTPSRSKQADRSWKPAREAREFPTVALEPSTHLDYVTLCGRHVVKRYIDSLPPPQVAQGVLFKRGRDNSDPTIEGEGLTIPFHTLLLDEPGEGEGDFVLTAEMLLHDLAERVWDSIEDAEKIQAKKRG